MTNKNPKIHPKFLEQQGKGRPKKPNKKSYCIRLEDLTIEILSKIPGKKGDNIDKIVQAWYLNQGKQGNG